MKVIGLTGGIATGKSTVSRMLAEAGAHVIDADRLAREVVEPGQPAWEAVVAHFGRGILRPDGRLDRERLADIVFHDPAQKAALDRIVHPAVFEAMARCLAEIEKTAPEGIEIKVLGPGCPQCERLEREMMAVMAETGIEADLEHVRDLKEIASYGVMGSPALIINREVKALGKVPQKQKLMAWLTEAATNTQE